MGFAIASKREVYQIVSCIARPLQWSVDGDVVVGPFEKIGQRRLPSYRFNYLYPWNPSADSSRSEAGEKI